MSSGAHLTKELHDLIKSIGETRSKQEEDKIILAEQAKLREKYNEKNQTTKKQRENLIKAMYIEMLGHDASFSHIMAVNLTRNSSLSLKRLGYLCCTLFLNEDSELLILLIANLQRDLQGGVHEIVIALTALAKLINSTMINALYDTIDKLLTHQTDLVRKKAIVVLQKIFQINPSIVLDYEEKIRKALYDKEPSVMGSALNLYYEACRLNPIQHKEQASNFVVILKQVIDHRLPKEFDYHRIPAPWIQIKLLQILALLGQNDIKVSEQMYEILGQTLKRSEDTYVNIGNAVTYQCVKTIASIYPNQNLLEMASSSVSKFLTSETNNMKYLGINALIKIAQVESKHVLQHQRVIVDCLENNDETLKRETLHLLYKMTNNQNIQIIVDKLLFFLKSASDPHFKKDLVNKICELSENFSPNQEWFLKTMNQVFEHGAEFIDNKLLNNFLRLVAEHFFNEGEEFGTYLIDSYIEAIQKPNLQDIIYQKISWVMGEVGAQLYANNSEKLNQMVELLMTAITNDFEDIETRSWILNSLAKLSSCPSFEMGEELQACFEYYQSSRYLDIHQRSSDFIKLRKYNAALRQSHLVNLDENLSFLDGFVKKAISNGAKEYSSSQSIKAVIGTGAGASEIYFEAKTNDKLFTQRPVNEKEETEVKTAGTNNLWDSQGYKGKVNDGVSDTVINKPAGGFGGFQQNFEGKQSISSKDFEGTSRPSNPNPNSIHSSTPSSNQQKKDDPKEAQQSKFMSDLFGGVEQNAKISKPTYGDYKKNIETQAQSKPTQQQKGLASNQNQGGNTMDLLDMMDMPSNTSNNNQQQQQGPPIFGSQQKAGGPPIFGKKAPGQGPPVFGAPKQVNTAPTLPPQKPFKSYQINLEQYEELWGNLSQEVNQVVNTRIKSEQDLKNCFNSAGISIIDVSGDEFICGTQTPNSQKILIYTVLSNTGSLDFTIKANSVSDINSVISFFIQGYSA